MLKSPLFKSFCLYLFGALLALHSSHATAQAAPKPPVFVLVHGAWHGGWCWQKVSAQLRATGAVVYTPTLSGLGEHRNTLTPAIDLNTHITDIVNLLVAEDLHDVVLVGHSYAGVVIAGVADRLPDRLRQLVFLDAMLADNGQSALSLNPKEVQAVIATAAAQDHGLSVPAPSSAAFGITNLSDIQWVNQRLTPQPYRTFTQPLVLTHPFGNHLPLSYIACTSPELPVLEGFATRARQSKSWTYYALPTGHDAMLSRPTETAALLQAISKR